MQINSLNLQIWTFDFKKYPLKLRIGGMKFTFQMSNISYNTAHERE